MERALPPDILSPNLASVDDAAQPWTVLLCHSKMAFPLVEELRQLGLDYFHPLRSVRKIYKDKKTGKDIRRTETRPIFSGYIFFNGSIDNLFFAIATTHKICGFLAVKDQPLFRRELRSFERALVENPRLGGAMMPQVGQRCIVTSGPFQGVEGVVEANGNAFITLRISMLNQNVPMQIDGNLVEAL